MNHPLSERQKALLSEIDRLKKEKPEGWKRKAKDLFWDVWCLYDPMFEVVRDLNTTGNPECAGRHFLDARVTAPAFDRMDDESEP